jgi:hypothetical protein
MMVRELTELLTATAHISSREAYMAAIVEDDVLGKQTTSNRRHSAQRLSELYVLGPAVLLFRVLHCVWGADAGGRPLTALLGAPAVPPVRATASGVFPPRRISVSP